jgi:hypothetical protein
MLTPIERMLTLHQQLAATKALNRLLQTNHVPGIPFFFELL